MKTKLAKLLSEEDRGLSSATGLLSKITRKFWKDLDFDTGRLGMLIQLWLDDPDNQFELIYSEKGELTEKEKQTRLENARGNLRKDLEKDDMTWRIFTRNLRIMRPVEIRFLVRLKFRDGKTLRQVGVIKPPRVNYFKPDTFKKLKELDMLEQLVDAADYDDEGYHKSEAEYNPNREA